MTISCMSPRRDRGRVALAHFFEPHNAHVVPVFRLWTYALVTISNRLVNLPFIFAAAGYLGLIAAMLVLGLVVARETHQPAVGLSAMAVLGVSTVIHPVVTRFSASQALWAGTAILLTLAFLQLWCKAGGTRRLIPVALTALMAPTIWTGGVLAGPAVIAYLASKKSLRNRVSIFTLTGVTLCSLVLILAVNLGQLGGAQLVWEKRLDVYPRPVQAVLHTAQALVEVCVCGNLGLDVKTTPPGRRADCLHSAPFTSGPDADAHDGTHSNRRGPSSRWAVSCWCFSFEAIKLIATCGSTAGITPFRKSALSCSLLAGGLQSIRPEQNHKG